MSINAKKKKGEIFNAINITPLTDIFLVLLIIMMVIAPLLDQQGLNLAVPKIGAPMDKKKEFKTINVEVAESGDISIDSKIISKGQLLLTLNDMKKAKSDGLIIQASPEAKHQDVVFVMDAARTAGIENLTIMEKINQPQK